MYFFCLYLYYYVPKKVLNTIYQIVSNCLSGWERGVGIQNDDKLAALYILWFSAMFELL